MSAVAFVAVYNNDLREHNTSKSTSFKCFSDSLRDRRAKKNCLPCGAIKLIYLHIAQWVI